MERRGGSLVREYYEIGEVRRGEVWVRCQVERSYELGRTDYELVLRVDLDCGRGELDAEEVASLHAELPGMRKALEAMMLDPEVPPTRVQTRGELVRIGYFVSPRLERKGQLEIEVGERGRCRRSLDLKDFPKIVDLISQAHAKMQELQRR
jgi:hypothetical protein